jgi:undecaprenyl-diphosphatase
MDQPSTIAGTGLRRRTAAKTGQVAGRPAVVRNELACSLLALPAALLVLIGLFSLLGLLAVGPYRGVVDRFDYGTAVWVRSFRSPGMDRLMWAFSQVLEMEPVAFATGLLFFYFLFRRRFANAAAVGIPLLGVGTLWLATAHLVQRPRPDYWVPQDPRDLGYPSGHVMSAVVLAALTMQAAFPRFRRRWSKPAMAAAWALLILAIGASRIYRHAHYATDNIAGFCMGLAWILVVLRAHPRVFGAREEPRAR